jgi:DNA-binding NarL/FixJ family response regulator
MIKIFIIEDHPVTIAGLRNFFRPSRDTINITRTSNDVNEALMVDDSDSFDVIFLDLFLPSGEPTQNYIKIAERYPGKPIVIYSGESSARWQRRMYRLGCKGFLNKNSDKCLIDETLRRVMDGETVYSAGIKEYLTKRSIEGYKDSKYAFTIEQQGIIKLFIEGMSSKEIAPIMGRDRSTINKHLKKIKNKFGVTSDVDLTKILLKHQDPEFLDSN